MARNFLLGFLGWGLAACTCFAGDEWRTPAAEFGLGDLRSVFYGPGAGHCVSYGNNRAFLLDITNGDVITAFEGHTAAIVSATTVAEGGPLLTVSGGGVVKSWDIQTGETLQTINLPMSRINAAVFSPDAKHILATNYLEQSARLFDIETGQQIHELAGHNGLVSCLAYGSESPSGRTLIATGSSDNAIRVWYEDAGELKCTFLQHTDMPRSIAFSPTGDNRVVSGDYGHAIWVWDASDVRAAVSFSNQTSPTYSVSFSPDGKTILTAGGIRVALWNSGLEENADTGAFLNEMLGHSLGATYAAFSPEGSRILSCGMDQWIKLWDPQTAENLLTYDGHNAAVYCSAFSPDGTQVLIGNGDTTAALWSVESGEKIRTFRSDDPWERHIDVINSIGFDPLGTRVLTGSRDGTAKLWDAADGALLMTFEKEEADRVYYQYDSVIVDTDETGDAGGSTVVLTASEDQTATSWGIDTGDVLSEYSGHEGSVMTVDIWPKTASNETPKLITGGKDKKIIIWDMASKEILNTLEGHANRVLDVAVSPDRTKLLSGSIDATAKLWDLNSGSLIHTFEGHSSQIDAVAFSPDGAMALTGSSDDTFRLWSVSTGEMLASVWGHFGQVRTAVFSPDGAWILTGSEDGTAKLWRVSDLVTPVAVEEYMLH